MEYCVGHFTLYANIESLCCTRETNIITFVIYISIKTKTIRTIKVHDTFYHSRAIITKVREKIRKPKYSLVPSFKKYIKKKERDGEKFHSSLNLELIIAYFNRRLASLSSPTYLFIKNKMQYLLMSDYWLSPLPCCGLFNCYSLVTL